MYDKPIQVRAHSRARHVPKTEAEESFIAEFPSIAPQTGTKIIDAKATKASGDKTTRGVKRLGGGDHGKIEKGVKRLGC